MRFAIVLAVALVLYGLMPLPWWAYIPANLALAAALVATARRRGHSLEELGLGWRTLARGTVIGIGAGAIVLIVVAVGSLLTSSDPQAAELVASQADVGPLGLGFELLVRIPLGTVILEAIAFRGVLFAAVERVRTTAAAVIVTSLAFGLWHIGPTLHELRDVGAGLDPFATVGAMVAITTLGGLLFAVLRLVGRSLMTSALVHWSMNAAGLISAVLVAGL